MFLSLMRTPLCVLILILWLVSVSKSFGAPRFPAAGTVAGQRVEVTVDSVLASYYLGNYLSGDRSNVGYVRHIDQALSEIGGEPSDREVLRRLSERLSTDFATIWFVAKLYDNPTNRRAQDAFHCFLKALRTSEAGRNLPSPETRKSYLVAFIPGYAYKKDRTTGADFELQRQVLAKEGFRTLLIETDELGSVEDNAGIVAREVARLARLENKVILVSASKGGPEVALALGERLPPDSSRHLRAWISVGGLLRGSPYADQALWWPKRWIAGVALAFQGLRPGVIKNLSTQVRRPMFERLRLPEHILTLQYVGAPLSGHLGESVWGRYSALRPLGPNDGLTLLADELVPGGSVVTDIGLDHYYRDAIIDLKTLALAYVVLEDLEGSDKAISR